MCQITIDSVVEVTSPSVGILVTGTISGCKESTTTTNGDAAVVLVSLDHPDGNNYSGSAVVVTNGNVDLTRDWSLYIKAACGGIAHITATCDSNRDCVTVASLEMQCRPPQGNPCPSVTLSAANDEGCRNGRRVISITATVNSGEPLNAFAQWQYGNNQTASSDFVNSLQTTVELEFSPSDLAHTGVTFRLTPSCEYETQIPASLLQACDRECPNITMGAPRDAGCDVNNNRVIQIDLEFDGEPITGYVNWRYGSDRLASSYLEDENATTVALLYNEADLEQTTVFVDLFPDCSAQLEVPNALLQPCEPDDGGGQEEGEEEEGENEGDGETGSTPNRPFVSPSCLIWLILNFLLLVATGVMIVIAGCIPNPATIIITIVLAAITLVSWFLFWLVCLAATGNCALARWVSFLLDLLATIMVIIAAVWGIVTAVMTAYGLPVTVGCFVGAMITFAYYSTIALAFKYLVDLMGCFGNGESRFFPWQEFSDRVDR